MKRKPSLILLTICYTCLVPSLAVTAVVPIAINDTQAGSSTQPAKHTGPRLEDGTPVKLRVQRTISSSDAQVNDTVDFDVIEEIKVNDIVVIPKGSIALGTVTAAQSKRRMARGGKLNVNIDSVRLADGEKAALRAVKEVKGVGHTGAMAGAMVATAVFVPAAAPLFLFMHGKDITIPKGAEVTAYVNGDFTLDLAKFAFEGGNQSPSSRRAAATFLSGPITQASDLSTIVVKSTPDGADIKVDGRYVGSTPSTVRIAPGDHTISIERPAFRSWQRTINVNSGGDITVNAILERE